MENKQKNSSDDYISGYANDMPSSKLAAMLLLGLRIIKKKKHHFKFNMVLT
jgi:hypothetical protein